MFAEIMFPYFDGFVVFCIMVMAGDSQLSAKRYLTARQPIASQKLSWRRNMPRVKGIEMTWPMMHTQAMVMGFLPPYLSLMTPPMTAEMNPSTLRLRAFADANSTFMPGYTD